MFNDLNGANNPSRPAVDDIFAETDKASEGSATGNSSLANSGIETKRVGLTATDGVVRSESDKIADNKWFKIILIVIIAAILILSGYLAYSKFFKSSAEVAPDLNSKNSAAATPLANSATTTPTPSSDNSGSFVTPTGGTSAGTGTTTIPEIPGVNAPAETAATTTAPSSVTPPVVTDPASLIDSDSDGLSDGEEKTVGTNINVIDTDTDALSDYEEVKIYHTNPLSADSDSDGYPDGAEVKSGYDPNVKGGKLTKPVSTPK